MKQPPVIHKSNTCLYLIAPNNLSYQITTHASCICNERQSLYNRHLTDRSYLKFDPKAWRRVAIETKKFYPNSLIPSTYSAIINRYTGQKKRMYIKALENLRSTGMRKAYGKIKMFIKPDRLPVGADKDPRAIQYRRPEFNLSLMRFIHAFEHHIYGELHYGSVSKTRVIAKGLNNYQRASLVVEKASYFNNPLFILADHARFDSTINVEHLKSTHKKYQKAFKSKQLQQLLNMQIFNRGETKHGIKYKVKGTRMSGDPDTGCGNTVVNLDAIYGVLKQSNITKYDMLLDGDDSIIIIEKFDLPKFDYQYFETMGFETKLDYTENIHKAEFCQCRIIFTGQGPLFVRNPERALSHTQCCRKHYAHFQYPQWLAAVGECELAMNSGSPIMQKFGQQLSSVSKIKLYDEDYKWKMEQHAGYKATPITEQARITYYEAWGVSPYLQQLIENSDFTSNSIYFYTQFKKTRYKQIKNVTNLYLHNVRTRQQISTAQSIFESNIKCSGSSWWCCS